MCGVAAIYSYHYASPPVDRQELKTLNLSMANRGPDGSGEWFSSDGSVGLAHRRLSIIDLSEKASQPMFSDDKKISVSFNGEIYNYRELRESLQKKGYVFHTQSDTEVLIHLYREKKEGMFSDLRGMFGFVLWDENAKVLLLARDPYGIKPLYYANDGWTIRIASQVKSLLKSKKISRILDPAGAAGFFLFGSVPEPFTLFQEIRQVPAGSFIKVTAVGPTEPIRYFSLAQTLRKSSEQSEGPDAVREALLDSVRHHLVADVELGLFLSSGVDSSALLGLLNDAGAKKMRCVTLAFEEYKNTDKDELPLAEKVAARYGAVHTRRYLGKEEFRSELPTILKRMDQPTIDGLNTYFVSKAAREMGLKVALSGVGGDELFGGYPSFNDIPSSVRRLSFVSKVPFAGNIFSSMHRLTRPFFPQFVKWGSLLKYGGNYEGAYLLRRGLFMPGELNQLMGRELAAEGLKRLRLFPLIAQSLKPDPGNPFSRVAALESNLYMKNQLLRDTDWAGMAHSLEIRTPWVDSTLLKKIGGKRIRNKKELAAAPQTDLPKEILSRPKTGFTIPMNQWLHEMESDEIKNVPILAKSGTPWPRKWAWVVYKRTLAECGA
jgi:asparagine synthase (glutamine-hydrolysing)